MLRLFSTQTCQLFCQIEHQEKKHSHNVCRHHVRQTRHCVFRVIKSHLFNLCFVRTHFHLIIIEDFFQIHFQFKKSTIKRVFNVYASCVHKFWLWNKKKIQLIKRLIELKTKQSTFIFIEHMSNLNDVIYNFKTIQSIFAQSINEFNTNSVAFVFNINFAFIEHMMNSRNDIHNFKSIQRQFLCSMHIENAFQHEINNDYFIKWREWILREIVFEIKCQYITIFYDEFDSYVNIM